MKWRQIYNRNSAIFELFGNSKQFSWKIIQLTGNPRQFKLHKFINGILAKNNVHILHFANAVNCQEILDGSIVLAVISSELKELTSNICEFNHDACLFDANNVPVINDISLAALALLVAE